MAWHVILCSMAYIDAPNKGIEQACSWASCDIHISHLVSIYTSTFSNVLLVLALNLIMHKSSYCKCSLAWCQARTFLLFTIWTHPLQMREYPLHYASSDKNKKSHYNKFTAAACLILLLVAVLLCCMLKLWCISLCNCMLSVSCCLLFINAAMQLACFAALLCSSKHGKGDDTRVLNIEVWAHMRF